MAIGKHLEEFAGLPAFDFPLPGRAAPAPLPGPDAVAWRVRAGSWTSDLIWSDAFTAFLETVDSTRVTALIVGHWLTDATDPGLGGHRVIEALTAARDRLPALRALFFGDITYEENEISWIDPGPAGTLLETFPALREFGIRGSEGLGFPPVRHPALERLTLESGGLPGEVVRNIGASDLPALTALDLWLGTSEYGWDGDISDIAAICAGDRLPQLRHLALRNSEIQDEVCAALAAAPVVAGLETLDLSMGVLTDDGAAALLGGQPLTHLKRLDLHHNYLSRALLERLRDTLEPAGVILDLDPGDAQDDMDGDGTVWRFVACGE